VAETWMRKGKKGEREKKWEDFGWVFDWIYSELSKNYYL